MSKGIHSDCKQQTNNQSEAQKGNKGQGISLPAIPFLQKKDAGDETIQWVSGSGTTETKTSRLPSHTDKTGIPAQLKSGVEALSGMDLSDVKVHYNSAQPAQLNALAYAHGSDIHIGPGQEKHLPHEAWHVVQQRQGRVQPTMQMKQGVPVNDDPKLEHEADVMGEKASQLLAKEDTSPGMGKTGNEAQTAQFKQVVQLGGGPKPAEVGLIDAEKVHTHEDFVIFHGTKSDGYSYVEALILEDKTTVCAAYVQIITAGSSVTLHTKAEGKYQGGIGTAILPIAIAVVASKHVSDDSLVTLPMGGAAVIKLLVEKLSKILGTPDIHSVADLWKLERKKKPKGDTEIDPDKMDPEIAKEHSLHMQSLMNSDKGKQLNFTSYGRKVVESDAKEIEFSLEQYIEKITTAPSQLFVDVPGKLFLEFARGLR